MSAATGNWLIGLNAPRAVKSSSEEAHRSTPIEAGASEGCHHKTLTFRRRFIPP